MKFICFALVCGVGATSASCDTPEDDVLSALQYAVKVKEHDMPMEGNTPGVPCTTCQGQEHNMVMTAPDNDIDGPWRCLNYHDDLGQNNDWCAATSEHEGFEMKFNGGVLDMTPGCGRCWCCTLGGVVPGPPAPAASLPPVFAGVVEHSDWQCHDYATEGGNNDWCSGSPMNGPFQIRFTAGDDDLAPGCGDCWCCKRDTREKCPDWFGNMQMCGDRELKPFRCSGMGQLSCTSEHLTTACGSVEKACCADEDGSCADNDYQFACLESAAAVTPTPTMTKPSPAPAPAAGAPAWMGTLPLCGNRPLYTFTDKEGEPTTSACSGTNQWDGCPESHLSMCKQVGPGACCEDADGSCADMDFSFACPLN